MALLLSDSFDHYTSLAQKCFSSNGGISIGAFGRNGTNGLRGTFSNGGSVTKYLGASKASLVAGIAYKFSQGFTGDGNILSFMDGANEQISVRIVVGQVLRVSRNGTTLATGTTVLSTGVYYYVEFKAVFATGATGSYQVKINGVVELTGSAVQTSTTTTTADRVEIGTKGGTAVGYDADDFYICDLLGAQNTDFLGDIRVQAILPSGAGATTAWTPSAGANYAAVDEAAPNDDTDYVASNTVGQTDTYAYGDVTPTAGVVLGIQLAPYVRKDDAGARTIAPVIRQSGVDYVQADLPPLSVSYQYLPRVIELSPATGLAFTLAEVNALEAGHKVTA